jgi:hypothetical protein
MKETPLTKTQIEELEGAPIKEQPLTVSDVELGPMDELIYTPGGGGIVLREEDFGPPSMATDTFRRVSTPLSATKRLTRETRSLLDVPGFGATSEYLRSIDAPSSVQALVGLPADILQSGLGLLGTGIMGALSAPVEVAGLFMSPQSKRKLTRDIGGMLESQSGFGPTTLAGRAYGASSARRKYAQEPASKIAREAQELGVTPPATVLGPTTAGIAGAVEELPIVGGRLLDEPKRVAGEISIAAGKIAPKTKETVFKTGEKIKKSVEKFGKTTKEKQEELFSKVDELIPEDTNFKAPSTVNLLNEIKDEWAGFSSAAKTTGDTKALSLLNDLEELGPIAKALKAAEETGDTEVISVLKIFGDDSTLTPQKFKSLRRLRTSIGEAISGDGGLLSQNLAKGTLKRLYGALSDDIDSAAASMGDKAASAYARANKYFKGRAKRIEGVLQDISKLDDPEASYSAVTQIITRGSPKESQNSVIKLKKSLSDDEFQDVSKSILGRMGVLDDVPEGRVNFDPSLWLKQYQSLSPYAKKTLANSAGGKGTSEQLDKLARYIKLTAEESSPSNYRFRRGLTQLGFITGATTTGAIAGGMAGAALGAGMIAATGLGVSQLLTNKSFLKALNKMAVGDTGPMRALANSKDLSAPSAKIAIQAYEED